MADITQHMQKGSPWAYQQSEIPAGANVSDLRNETKIWGFQFDVQDAGTGVWVGGTEHLISRYDKASLDPHLHRDYPAMVETSRICTCTVTPSTAPATAATSSTRIRVTSGPPWAVRA